MTKYTESRIRQFILDDHPCVMAQSLVADESLEIQEFESIDNYESNKILLGELKIYIERQEENSKNFESFIAVFRNDLFENEISFEKALWKLLSNLHELDDSPWDSQTSSDPTDDKFSFSLHGTSFYIVGMHPSSSRFARKSPYTMIVFNLHSQFEKLREINRYDRVRDLIRRRDKALQGSVNPMLADFGTKSEARQYSGRKVEADWICPFSNK
ncbi:guanitoxin biosynthesis heme-dependent pre-guanitoxin N-hydroxylase GntA [Nonlabens antarcticus]|uniref:guanitoxin biosynthesis heme-dependent pre-guanitoxin N-hydroxylase GntA n=1 Tax=Nonlabens antarcticus TaxID=392714 RepID=UPI00189147F8|nr:guanitoxin biosynthesis heme-dependent pre-guanitoxin N-hydroxylase GntA [Nonlabens antarcticus]